jgi:hypothetical protein
MATTLVSPGVSVEVIDESFYASSGPGTVPFILLATQQDKTNPSGAVAEGTLQANAGKVYSISSKRELLNLFGTPIFPKTSSGIVSYGSEIAEYGLLAAHSVLDVSARVYVMRADVDLTQLIPSSTRPTGEVTGGTLYLDTAATKWGVFEWSATTQAFTNKVPRVITSTSDLDSGIPKASIGNVGDYAVVATNTNNPTYYKGRNGWVLVGSSNWKTSWPTVTGTGYNPLITVSHKIIINGTLINISGTTVSALATQINNLNILGVTAVGTSGYLVLYATAAAKSDGSTVDGKIAISNDTGTALTALGIVAGTYASPATQLSAHTSVPEWKDFDSTPRPTGSVWIKTTAVSSGASMTVYRWSATAGAWQLQSVNLYATDASALNGLDSTRGGLGIPLNTMYMQYDVSADSTVTYSLFYRQTTGITSIVGTEANPVLTSGNKFTISASLKGSSAMPTPTEITLSGTTAASMVADILAADITNVSARVSAAGAVVIEHTLGGVLHLKSTTGTPLLTAGITSSTTYCRSGPSSIIIGSNWKAATYTPDVVPPVASPLEGTLWYPRSPLEADIMIHDGANWKGYQQVTADARGYDLSQTDPSGPIIAASAPTEQSDGTALEYGDLWIDTSDLENYPVLYRWQAVLGDDKWVLLDNSDHTSENGVLFADARWDTDGTVDPALDDSPAITDLLLSDYLDLDGPDPAVYPRGVLLFNTRRSSYNVKYYSVNHWNNNDFPLEIMPTIRDTWITASGAKSNGTPYFGRTSQRDLIVAALRSAVDTSEELREDSRFFNLICCPGYPELTENMIALNTARRETAFIISDMPMGLSSDSIALESYLTSTSATQTTGEDGWATNNSFAATFYPSCGLTNDTTGTQVVVPASHMILRTFVKSDNKSFPWFAPAGEQRGAIDNATSVGYVDRQSGAFVSVGTKQGLRDLLYANRVNPIAVFAGSGILNYGQKTRATASTALDRINVARLINYIRYQLERITKPLIFEPNDKITRNEAKQSVESLLNDILTSRGLYDYLVVCDESNNTPERIDRNELHIDIAIEPTKAVEFIYIPVRIKNTGEIASGNLSAVQTV